MQDELLHLMNGEDSGELKLADVEDALERYREALEAAESRPAGKDPGK